jgi:glycosyltransferase involved in cell wall biosynthesis
MNFGPSELEQLLYGSAPAGGLDGPAAWVEDAWSVEFPDLRALPAGAGAPRPLRICIATEDIVGPVRNGGIGTTYTALAELLAGLGHHTTILYLLGQDVETGDVYQWVRFYAEKGINFVPVPNYSVKDDIRTNGDRWMRAPYNMLRYLTENPMDVVHASEWRGAAYLSLLAKRQGLAFDDTLFIIKTSSPWMWSRMYGSQPLDRLDDLAKIHAERRSVELADIVIGGSLHLLRWMGSQGYRIPRSRTFVQPNVANSDALRDLMGQRPASAGCRIPINEFVFFGRLEARKGLVIFCQAIRRLIRLGVPLPRRISFMGKPGARLTVRPNQTIMEYLDEITKDWPTEVNILTHFQQHQAIQYLLEGPRLAVMPSLIENSSMAIYEVATCGIPCVASSAGGNPELVVPEDRAQILCDAHPLALADKLREAIELGGYIPRPSFDNETNLQTWRDFHQALASGLRDQLLSESRPPTRTALPASVSVCIYCTGREAALRSTLASLASQEAPALELLIALDADRSTTGDAALTLARELGIEIRVIETFDLDAGASFNMLARAARGDFVLFLWEGATLRPHGLRVLDAVARTSGGEVLNYFHRVIEKPEGRPPRLKAPVFGSTTDSFFRTDITYCPLFVKRQKFLELKGFSSDYRALCAEYEFVAKAQLARTRCETVLLDLGEVPAWDEDWLSDKGYDIPASQLRAIRPNLSAVPLDIRDLLLISKGMQIRPTGAIRQEKGQDKSRNKRKRAGDPSDDDAGRARRPSWLPWSRAARPPDVRGPAAVGESGLLRLIDDLVVGPGSSAQRQPPKGATPTTAARPADSGTPLRLGNNLVRKGSTIGQTLALYENILIGWALDLDDPARKIEMIVTVDGMDQPAVRRADGGLPLAISPPSGIEGHGFSIPLRNGSILSRTAQKMMSYFGRPVAPRRYSVRSADGLALTESRALPPAGATLATMGVEGFCDPSDDGVFKGWAWRPSNSDARLDIAVFIDGKFLARVTASRYREDVHHQGRGDGEYGFDVEIPEEFRDGGRYRIEAIVADIGLPLGRSPLCIQGRRLAFEAKKKGRAFL